ncbi:Ago2 [Symbiodinium sp. CCMP2456]|nr:Ago2 [Symbiodinium sp. CCMP2456]
MVLGLRRGIPCSRSRPPERMVPYFAAPDVHPGCGLHKSWRSLRRRRWACLRHPRPRPVQLTCCECKEVSPVEETLRQAQVPFILMIRSFFPLLASQVLLQGRQVLLNLVLVGHSHGGVIAHSMAQCLESAGFLVKGIVAADTLGLPRKAEMPLPRFDPQALARHRSPYHWHLSSPKVNMMAPDVPPLRRILPSRAELLVGGAVFPPKHLQDIDHSRILQQSPWDVAAVVSNTFRRLSGQSQ